MRYDKKIVKKQKVELCQVEKKESDTRFQRTKEKRGFARIAIRRKNNF